MQRTAIDTTKETYVSLLGEDLADRVLEASGVRSVENPQPNVKLTGARGLLEVEAVDGSKAILALRHLESIVFVTGDELNSVGLELATVSGAQFRKVLTPEEAAELIRAWDGEVGRS